jgi:hypothetical protein
MFRGLYIITLYDHSKLMIELNLFDRSKMEENMNMNIPISSMKTKSMLTETHSEQIVGLSYELSVIKTV